MVDKVEVSLGADVSAAKSGMADGSAAIAASLQGIQRALENFGKANKDTVDRALRNNADLSRSFLELKASVTTGFNAITGVVERFRGVLGTLAAALAGGAIFKGAVDSMLNLEDAVRGLIISFGMTAEKATNTAIALKLAGLSAETYEQMGQRVGRVLKTQSEEFDRLKVVTKDATGNLLPMDQILQNIYKRMQDFKAGTDQTEFALSTVGRNAKDFASDMERLSAVSERAAQMQKQLGIEMGPERIAQIERYRVEMNAFKVLLDEIGTKIGEAVLPRLEGLAAFFSDTGPTAVKYILNAIMGLLTVFQALGTLVASVAIEATNDFDKIVISAVATWQAIKAAASFNFAAIPDIMAEANRKIIANNIRTTEEIKELWQKASDKVNAMFGGSKAPPIPAGGSTGLPKSGNERFSFKPGADTGSLDELDNELKREQDAFNKMKLLQGSFQTWSIEQTRDYWEEVLSMTDLTAKQRLAAENKYYDAERQVQQNSFAAYLATLEAQKAALGHNIEAKIALGQKEFDAVVQRYGAESKEAQAAYKKLIDLRQQLADQRERIAEIEIKAEEATAQHAIAMNRLVADQQAALGQISAAQRLSIERDFVAKEYQIEVDAINKRIAILASDPTSDPAKLADLKAQLLKVEQDYQAKVTTIDNQAVLEREKYALQAQDAIKQSMADTLAQIVSNARNWREALMNGLKALDEQLVKIASNKVIEQLFGGGTPGGALLSKLTGGIFGGASAGPQVAAQTANTTAVGLLTAAVTANTAAVGAASISSGLGSSGFGIGSLFGGGSPVGDFGSLLSFDVGTPFVPRDMVAKIHKGEAVIPASMNKPGAMGSQVSMRNTFMFNGPVDTRTQAQIAMTMQRATESATRRNR